MWRYLAYGRYLMRSIRTIEIAAVVCLGVLLVPASGAKDQENPLRGKSVRQILDCAKDKTCASEHDQWELAGAVSIPGNIDLLIEAYKRADKDQKPVIVIALYSLRDPRVRVFMRAIAFNGLKPHEPDYDPHWYPLQYLAQACDQRALARLSRPENIQEAYPIGCMRWQDTVKAFGDCNYRPATPYLIEALSTACINIDDNAEKALKKFFPGVCEDKKWPEAMQQCYTEVARKHGYKMFR
jgi:hypothetical protein